MITSTITACSVPANSPVNKTVPASGSDAGKTGERPEAPGFGELLAREIGAEGDGSQDDPEKKAEVIGSGNGSMAEGFRVRQKLCYSGKSITRRRQKKRLKKTPILCQIFLYRSSCILRTRCLILLLPRLDRLCLRLLGSQKRIILFTPGPGRLPDQRLIPKTVTKLMKGTTRPLLFRPKPWAAVMHKSLLSHPIRCPGRSLRLQSAPELPPRAPVVL
jgi:hypothetical protein